MNRPREIEQELVKIADQLEDLYKRQLELNKELQDIRDQRAQKEFERWKIIPGSTFWLFDKENDSVYSVICGYEVLSIETNQFFKAIETRYDLDLDCPSVEILEETVEFSALKHFREENIVYVVDPVSYRNMQMKMLKLEITNSNLKSCEEELSKSLYQVE